MTGEPADGSTVGLWIRAFLFYTGLVTCTILYAPVCFVLAPAPYRIRFGVIASWVRVNLWWLELTCNLGWQLEGRENIPESPTVVICKHQSAWETLAINLVFQPQVWVLKRELLRIPILGWGLATLRPIAIDRKDRRTAVEQVVTQGNERLQSGCWVVIFPEGTRVAPGTRGRYRTGGARLARKTGHEVVPVAHNAGDYWPRNSFIKRPGRIRLVVGPVIESNGKTINALNTEAETWIEDTVRELRAADGFPEGHSARSSVVTTSCPHQQ